MGEGRHPYGGVITALNNCNRDQNLKELIRFGGCQAEKNSLVPVNDYGGPSDLEEEDKDCIWAYCITFLTAGFGTDATKSAVIVHTCSSIPSMFNQFALLYFRRYKP